MNTQVVEHQNLEEMLAGDLVCYFCQELQARFVVRYSCGHSHLMCGKCRVDQEKRLLERWIKGMRSTHHCCGAVIEGARWGSL